MINNKFRQNLGGNTSMFNRPEGDDTIEPYHFVVISAEGTTTENNYFEHFSDFLKEHHINVQFHVLNHAIGQNSPEAIYNLLREFKDIQSRNLISEDLVNKLLETFSRDEIDGLVNGTNANPPTISPKRLQQLKDSLLTYGIDIDYHKFLKAYDTQFDTFAVVLDRDKDSHSEEALRSVYQKCRDEQFAFCLSNPCFEFWLFLHLWDGTELPHEVLQQMLENDRISKGNTFMSKYLSTITHHSKGISKGQFAKLYSSTIKTAIQNAEHFALGFDYLLNSLGSNIGLFLTALTQKYTFVYP